MNRVTIRVVEFKMVPATHVVLYVEEFQHEEKTKDFLLMASVDTEISFEMLDHTILEGIEIDGGRVIPVVHMEEE